MELKVLGCVSPYPKEKSYCPGYLVSENNKKILLDCGNGCTSLLDMKNDLKDLIVIISHLHNDHYGDLLTLAYASYVYHNIGIINNKIKVYIPYPRTTEEELVIKYLSSFKETYLEYNYYDDTTKIKHGNIDINFRKSKHNITTYYAKLKSNDNTFVYSADTGYTDSLIEFSKSADILLCESTFARFQKQKTKYHLNSFEAGLIGKFADVNRLLLTHFWPEIDRNIYVDDAKNAFDNVEAVSENKVYKIGGLYENR